MSKNSFPALSLVLATVLIVAFLSYPLSRSLQAQGPGPYVQLSGGNPVPIDALTTVQTVSTTPTTSAPGQCTNADASNWAYLQLFDTAGAVTLGTTAPNAFYGIPPGGGSLIPIMNFYNGIKVAATTTSKGGTPAITPIVCTFTVR